MSKRKRVTHLVAYAQRPKDYTWRGHLEEEEEKEERKKKKKEKKGIFLANNQGQTTHTH
jgi:hypothetical protein